MINEFDTFAISPKESLSSVEAKITELILDRQYRIRLPATLNTRGSLGIEVAIIQLIGTWLKFNKHKKVFHSYQKNTPESFHGLCSSIYGIAALSLIEEVWDDKKTKLLKGLVLNEAKNTIENLRNGNFRQSFTSRYFGVPYIKTPRYDKEFEMPFYNGEDVIKSDAFYRIFERILNENIGEYSRFESLKDMIKVQELSDLLWEIFKNTHDHGRHDCNGNIYPENFRSIIIQQQDITNTYLDQWCGEKPTLAQQNFRRNWHGISEKHYFLDLSVIDFGAGFVELAKIKTGFTDNVDILLQCFQTGWSRLEDKSRGSGLTKVLNCIHKYKGWLRIRSGNLLLEKTFSPDDSPQIYRHDIQVMDTSVIGTSVHISLPLKGYNNQ
jgi:hypothetical protein